MKAIRYYKYGSPEVLKFEEIDLPSVGDEQVLVKVEAASVNPFDWHMMRGIPYLIRLSDGLFKPKQNGLGNDFSGRVEAVGRKITEFKVGDEVFGGARACLAEFALASKTGIALKPGTLTFEQAAAIPMAAITALQGLRDKGQIQPGQRVLINGASGGVGIFAVQIAKGFGAEVSGVCSTKNVELVRSLGADHVIDYSKENFTRGGGKYDLILDTVGNHSPFAQRRALTPKGVLVAVGGKRIGRFGFGMLRDLVKMLVLSKITKQKLIFLMADRKPADLITLKELVESGKIIPVIDRSYSLSQSADALSYLEAGRAAGKVVITP